MTSPIAVVTGASTGIGAATARELAKSGYHVVAGARRIDRVEALCDEIAGTALPLDVTSDDSVTEFAAGVAELGRPVRALVNNAGGALGLDPIESANIADWQRMYETNVLGTLRMTQALLPALEASGDGIVVMVGSTAGRSVYQCGAGYTAAKHAVAVMQETLRLELLGRPIRVTEVAPGMVHTEEFSLTRFGGDREKAAAVYAGVPNPLTADDVAEAVVWCVDRPSHVNIDVLVLRPRAQAGQNLYRVT